MLTLQSPLTMKRFHSIYTIAIGALGDNGRHAEYSEDCTAVMAVAYGGGDPGGSIVSNRLPSRNVF